MMKYKMASVVTSVVQIVFERSQKAFLPKKTCLLPTPHVRTRQTAICGNVHVLTLKTDQHRLKQQQQNSCFAEMGKESVFVKLFEGMCPDRTNPMASVLFSSTSDNEKCPCA